MMSSAAVEPVKASAKKPMASPGNEYILNVSGVRKAFPGVVALDDVQFRVRPGSVHALMGENGAGKSTLMKIVAGIYTPDKGTMHLRGSAITLKSPLDALENGIAMIHQELNLMPFMTVAENIWIRREPKNALGFINHGEMRERTKALFDELNIDIDPEIEIQKLSISNRQMVEIAKAVSFNSDVLIMDEPTSALTEHEVGHLFTIIRKLRDQGKGIVYITHKMNELFEIADEVSVFRDGKYIGTKRSDEVTRDDIIQMMVGREITQMFPKETVPIGEVRLSVKNLTLNGVFRDVSFDVRSGEILGFAGLIGSGRSEFLNCVFGITKPDTGTATLLEKPIAKGNPGKALRQGLALITEDRKATGLVLCSSVAFNTTLAALPDVSFAGYINRKKDRGLMQAMIERMQVKLASPDMDVSGLSGGNQQKVVLAKCMATEPVCLLCDEPTRGIDEGAKREVYAFLANFVAKGGAAIVVSSEAPEVLEVSDRIAIFKKGHLSVVIDGHQASQEELLHLAS